MEPSNLGDRIGRQPTATFEVARGTDTEDVRADPQRVRFGRLIGSGPMIELDYNKYNAFLPPWQRLVSFTLNGDEKAIFTMPRYRETNIIGNLKTVKIISPTVKLQ
jgi:hypothetical protein